MDPTPGREDQKKILVVREDEPLDEVAVLRVGAGDAFSPAALSPVDVRRHPLDVAGVRQRYEHAPLGDERLILDLHLLLGDLGAARAGITRAEIPLLLNDERVDLPDVAQDLVVARDRRLEIRLLLL